MKYDLAYIAKNAVNLMFGIAGTLLTLRFILRLFNANNGNDFVNWIYETSSEILGPFRNIFPAPNLDGFVIEFSTIFALVVYAIITMFAFYIIDMLTPRKSSRKSV